MEKNPPKEGKELGKSNNESSEPLSLPSKKEILDVLKEENPPIKDYKYEQMIFILEVKKISNQTGILKGEYYKEDVLEYRGSLLLPLGKTNPNQPSIWDDLQPNEYKFFGFTLDSREPKFPEKVANFFKRSFQDSTIQDFIPFAGKRNQKD